MKSISGSVVSSKRISLSKAASTVSTFLSTDTGASQSVSAYLKRASASFNELVQLRRELKARGRSERKRKRTPLVDLERRNPREWEAAQMRGRVLDLRGEDGFGDPGDGAGVEVKKKRDSFYDREGRGGRSVVDEEDDKNSERKMKMKLEIGSLVDDQNNLNLHRKKKKKRRREGEE